MASGNDLPTEISFDLGSMLVDPVAHDEAEEAAPIPSAIRKSLQAKIERLLRRPLIAQVMRPPAEEPTPAVASLPAFFRQLQEATQALAPSEGVRRTSSAWREEDDGTWTVSIDIDYADLWRGSEKEVLETVNSMVENAVTFLTDDQRLLLERSPREFLALNPRPESAELVSFRKQIIGGSERVVELTVAEPPRSLEAIRSIAVVPNLVPLERQLAALHILRWSDDAGPLAPLRALIGLSDAEQPAGDSPVAQWEAPRGTRLDEFQTDCVRKALTTPHFAVIKGPPGSGKTTVITSIVRQVLDDGGRVLVVSPTHVAVDNVVEKLVGATGSRDTLDPATLPVRYAARSKRLLPGAEAYWVGPKRQTRAATIATRLEKVLGKQSTAARKVFRRVDRDAAGNAPLTEAVASLQKVICGTPIGILSFDTVKNAVPGAFDLLVVDEVSKMTLPEFLAIAVKAKRWVLVGDPDQLPPFNNAEENGSTLDDVLPTDVELVLSVGTLVERMHPSQRQGARLLVVAADPESVAAGIREHLRGVELFDGPGVTTHDASAPGGILVCTPSQVDEACERLSVARGRDLTQRPDYRGSLDILVERGLRVARPAFAGGTRLVEPRSRAPAVVFETAFTVYHAQPWAVRARHRLRLVAFRNGIAKSLPSVAGLRALAPSLGLDAAHTRRQELIDAIATRFAVNTVSVFDWLSGIPTEHFDVAPLEDLAKVAGPLAPLRAAVRPFVGTLKKQYRMHRSLSVVPRDLFYFGEALVDGRTDGDATCRVVLVQVQPEGPQSESNRAEADAIVRVLGQLKSGASSDGPAPTILVITPYREQERLLADRLRAARDVSTLEGLEVEVCTLDRCQGREADYVFVSLVRGTATTFLDAPKRWNVALTRAMQGLFLVGDVDTYLREAQRGRAEAHRDRDGRPRASLLARILEAYDLQINRKSTPAGARSHR